MPKDVESIVVPSELTRINEAREWVAGRARDAGFDDESIFELELVVTEALSNVIRHAYENEAGNEITLWLAVDEEKLTLSVKDVGRPFDPRDHVQQGLDEPRAGGYGIFLMRELMDGVTATRSNDANVLTLTKSRRRLERA